MLVYTSTFGLVSAPPLKKLALRGQNLENNAKRKTSLYTLKSRPFPIVEAESCEIPTFFLSN